MPFSAPKPVSPPEVRASVASRLQRLNLVSTRLVALCAAFTAPLGVMLYQMVDARDQGIEFAAKETQGNEAQRALEGLLRATVQRHWARLRGEDTSSLDLAGDRAVEELQEVAGRLAGPMGWTPEALAQAGRPELAPEGLTAAWGHVRAGDTNAERALIGRLRALITWSGEQSNLILDPDLDSYYVMDVTLLAVPDIEDRLDALVEDVEVAAQAGSLSAPDALRLHTQATLLDELGVQRLRASTATALAKDADFYGYSPSLQESLPRHLVAAALPLRRVTDSARALAAAPDRASTFDIAAFRDDADQAATALHAMQDNGFDELDVLLTTREAWFEGLKERAILWTLAAATLASLLAAYLGRDLVRRARSIEHATAQMASGNLSVRIRMTGGDELASAAARFDEMADRIQALHGRIEEQNAALVALNAGLEREVAERTAHIQEIHDHVAFGFLLTDSRGVVRPGFTRSCLSLLESEEIAGRPIAALLRPSEPMGDATVTLAMLQLFEDLLPEELLIDQIPRRIELRPGKTIGLAVRPVRSPSGAVTAALWSLSDVTELVAAEEENAENRAIMKILAHREAYLAFLTETWQDLARAREACVVPDPSTVRQVVSSVKGNTTLYGMERVTHVIEDVEKRQKLTVDGIEHIELAVREFLDRHRRVLGDLARGVSTIPIPEAHLRELDAMLGDIEGLARIRAWSYEARQRDFTSLLGPIAGAVEHLATRFGKDALVTLEGGDLLLDPWRVAAVCRALDHVVRNALKHGLETPGERAGKAPQGRVHVGAYATAEEWRFEVTDDGRGIDVDALKARAVERGVISADEALELPRDAALALVFASGMGESDRAASDRVESLEGFAAAVHACGGRVAVRSEPGRGTTIVAHVPRATDLALAA